VLVFDENQCREIVVQPEWLSNSSSEAQSAGPVLPELPAQSARFSENCGESTIASQRFGEIRRTEEQGDCVSP
tara:strand:- start:186642 stop:186860 length:219 start_codon:yes stop_codon:yes gene_type:complete